MVRFEQEALALARGRRDGESVAVGVVLDRRGGGGGRGGKGFQKMMLLQSRMRRTTRCIGGVRHHH